MINSGQYKQFFNLDFAALPLIFGAVQIPLALHLHSGRGITSEKSRLTEAEPNQGAKMP